MCSTYCCDVDQRDAEALNKVVGRVAGAASARIQRKALIMS